MDIGVAGPIVNHKILQALLDNDIHTPQYGRKYSKNSSYLWSSSHFQTMCCHKETKSESFETGMNVYKPIFTHKNIKGSIGQQCTYSTRWQQNIVSVPYTYEARAIYILFRYHQDTECDNMKWKLVQLDKYSPIKVSKGMWENDIHIQ